ncbi:pirin family protein [Clostridium tertium]|jgi:quercetin 2,3-dioxygenase|nr:MULTISPECIES: pirin family protein [Clostridium]MDU3324346.1 pirin family protein [Escherichia coli]MBS5306839.1 pirin family protein [Clostridium sp.]MDB1921131.1 pirin family protein [Clostridium tertium]MDB1925172.1 pirin family protein [Clostridium tertium]MDB1928692.1 pirin family protein [Clostridium tertium]
MLRKLDHRNMGKSNLGWLKSIFHFSFAEYFNIDNMNFGVLRVINDDLIEGNTGFDLHPHKDMEIVSYVVDGELTHGDTMGNRNTISRGHVQYMSAGTGVYHSEHNLGDSTARLLQIWIIPDKKGYKPAYGDYRFNWDDRKNKWLNIVSSKDGDAAIKINQDANFYVVELDEGKEIDFQVGSNRQAYLVQIEGNSTINNLELNERDALEIIEEDILIKADKKSHILVIEMKKQLKW